MIGFTVKKNKYSAYTFLLATVFLLYLPEKAQSQKELQIPVVSIHTNFESQDLTQHLLYITDKKSTYTVEQLITAPNYDDFYRVSAQTLNLGFDRSTLWATCILKNSTNKTLELILDIPFPLIDSIKLYKVSSDLAYTIYKTGEMHRKSNQSLHGFYRNNTFQLTIKPQSSQLLYLSVHDHGSVPFSLHLMSKNAFKIHKLKDNALFGGYFSLFAIILLFNVIVFLLLRTKTHLYYILYLFSLLLWQLTYTGHSSLLLWNKYPYLNNHAIPFLISTTAICAILFSKNFLKTSAFAPKTNKFLNYLAMSFVVIILMSFLPDYTFSVVCAAFLSILFTVLMFWTAILTWLNGYKPARYFTIAWFFLLVGTMLLALKSFGLLPSNFVTEYGQYAGSLTEIFLLSLALVDMVENLKKEKEQALSDAFSMQIEAKEKLEIKVAERTLELTQANKQLEELSSQLSKYLSPQVYNSIFTGQTSATQRSTRKPLTVFFSDIAGFTDLTDSVEPEELSTVLNAYLTKMSDIALQFGGTIDKFIGDSLMIFFGDPESLGVREDALRCVKMSLEMRKAIAQFHMQFPQILHTPLKVRMGIHSGFCTVGSFGAENRLEYTIIGGTVNLASRLESLSDAGDILISSSTYAYVKNKINCDTYRTLNVKGIHTPVDTYKVRKLLKKEDTKVNQIDENGEGYSFKVNLDSLSNKSHQEIITLLKETVNKLESGNK